MARMHVQSDGSVACFIIRREDGHELSLSSMGNGNLIHWNGSEIVKDYGDWHKDAAQYLEIVSEFLSEEEPANV